ncbi:Ubiquitin-conjugating enzyme E2 6 [Verticillium nonalfalfae]|uniref:Ubiquitin-conjugating enzyme E2 6 n=1 Tax=Verticillium nonalfalfae TaxID=1051616 RepID=A0A3M9Y518_9PEZI|nr:Ubiquitin-conjugating enzyme E2 6 [Verticillium nonalfalfae]RNJ55394.1 Ubiquitin-conjugating enzyme E2 6 [Verticillium nonalfalfae]
MSASKAAQKRARRNSGLIVLTREYKTIAENPPPYIEAHPSESNILEWHYIITGPEDTPYHGGQYWGTLMFPPTYPFAPPAIRMHTPSGRFQPSTRLCLSISDFHPKSFNPAWEVSTILIGLLSFMTSEEMTTGSVSSTAAERRALAARSRWWNSTGGGSHARANPAGKGNVKAGDAGAKFRAEWPEVDAKNWDMMREQKVDMATGHVPAAAGGSSCRPPQLGIGAHGGGGGGGGANSAHQGRAVVDAVVQQRDAGTGWLHRNKLLVAGAVVFLYVLLARVLGNGE